MIINRYAKGGGLSPRIVVSVATGTTVTCSKGATTLTATSVDSKCSFNVNDYGVWTVATDSDTQTVDVEYVQLYEVTLKTISKTLNDVDWATIKQVADQSKGANYWAVGDTKQIVIDGKLSDGLTLSNYQTWVYIIGFDHNSEREGTGIAFQGFKTAQSNGTDICLCDSGYNTAKTSGQWFNMNNNNNNSGGWNGCNMRNNTLPVVKAALPSDLQAVIKTTTLYSDNTGGGSDVASYVTATQDTLYLLAEFEIFGARTFANTAEQNYQKQYAYYVAGNSKVKYQHNSTATAARWWERSVSATTTTLFCNVIHGGNAAQTVIRYPFGLAPAFKVGGGGVVTKPASSLPVGSSIYAKESGAPAEFIVVHQGNPDSSIYDASCDGTWLLRNSCYDGGRWWVGTSTRNRYESSRINDLFNNNFLDTLDIKDIIKTVKIPYRYNGGSGGEQKSGSDGLECKVFALSSYEVGITTADFADTSTEGSRLNYFESGTGESANNKRIVGGDGYANWWLRSINITNNTDACAIGSSGQPIDAGTNNSRGFRPCFIIPSDTEVDEFGNIVV